MCFNSSLVQLLTGTLGTMLNDTGDSGCLFVVPNLNDNIPVFLCRPWGYFLGCYSIMLRKYPSNPILLGVNLTYYSRILEYAYYQMF